MIPRYSTQEMQAIWSDDNRFKIWLEIELLVLEQLAECGLAPKAAAQVVRSKAQFDAKRVLEIEEQVKHDVIAFLTNVAESVGPEARYVHRGMTSSDLLDTALAVQIKQSGELVLAELSKALSALKTRAQEFKETACIGRSHGIHAEPTTFGLKLAGWYAELRRQERRFASALNEVSVGKIAGAVGTYASMPPQVESAVLDKLGLKPEIVSTQVVSRDRHAHIFLAIAEMATSIERFAVEIRHLQRTEVREVEEGFSKGQKGSSAMPHKRNPILSENLSGLARLLRGYASSSLENVALWHERDISHSSVERVIGPDAFILIHFILRRFTALISALTVYPDQMKKNLELTKGIYTSGTLLIKLVDKGITREQAYKMVQDHAMAAWQGGKDFPDRVREDSEITKLFSEAELSQIFDLKHHLQHVDLIFSRAFKE